MTEYRSNINCSEPEAAHCSDDWPLSGPAIRQTSRTHATVFLSTTLQVVLELVLRIKLRPAHRALVRLGRFVFFRHLLHLLSQLERTASASMILLNILVVRSPQPFSVVRLYMVQRSWPNVTPALQIIMMPSAVERPRKRPKAIAFRNSLITLQSSYHYLRTEDDDQSRAVSPVSHQISSRTLSESTVQAIFDRLGSPRARDSANFFA